MNQTRDLGDLTFCLSITVASFVSYKEEGGACDEGQRKKGEEKLLCKESNIHDEIS